jgi:protein tyrosine/serine phosphatase
VKKIIKWLLILPLLGLGIFVFWYNNLNHAYRVVTDGKVYKSGLIPPQELENYLIPNRIKTVVNLLDPGVQDRLNPAKQEEIDAEDEAINKINNKYKTNIKHVSIPSGQIPTKKTLEAFYKIIDDPDSYPLHIHCYHGTGRAAIYSAIYRMEKENWDNKKAQENTRLFKFLVDSPLHHSSFAKGRSKGDFILNYKPRSSGSNATIKLLK